MNDLSGAVFIAHAAYQMQPLVSLEFFIKI